MFRRRATGNEQPVAEGHFFRDGQLICADLGWMALPQALGKQYGKDTFNFDLTGNELGSADLSPLDKFPRLQSLVSCGAVQQRDRVSAGAAEPAVGSGRSPLRVVDRVFHGPSGAGAGQQWLRRSFSPSKDGKFNGAFGQQEQHVSLVPATSPQASIHPCPRAPSTTPRPEISCSLRNADEITPLSLSSRSFSHPPRCPTPHDVVVRTLTSSSTPLQGLAQNCRTSVSSSTQRAQTNSSAGPRWSTPSTACTCCASYPT